MDITLAELLKGSLAGAGLIGVFVFLTTYIVVMFLAGNRLSLVVKSHLFTKRFGEDSNTKRLKLMEHLIEHGLTRQEAADCMNSWKE
jgi:hypothetical protein